jgi:hypothetical protein
VSAAAFLSAVPAANPEHKIEFSFDKEKITYADGSTETFDKTYKALIVNGGLIKSDVKTINDRTLVPIRALAEALNGTVDWDEAARMVTVHKDDKTIVMTIGSKNIRVNDIEQAIDVAPDIYSNYTYLPIRFVSEALGADVAYTTGYYDTDSKKFSNFMIVRGIQGNVIVDQFDPAWPVILPDEAAARVQYFMNTMFSHFKPDYTEQRAGDLSDAVLQSTFQMIQQNIDSTNVIGAVSRYYVVESASLFLFDKFTGELYSVSSDGASNTVSRFVDGNENNFRLFVNGYFTI